MTTHPDRLDQAYLCLDGTASERGAKASRLAITWARGVEELQRRGWPEDVLVELLHECEERLAKMPKKARRDDGIDIAYERAVEA